MGKAISCSMLKAYLLHLIFFSTFSIRHPSLAKGEKYKFMKHGINKYALFAQCRVAATVQVKITEIQLYIVPPHVMIHLTKIKS